MKKDQWRPEPGDVVEASHNGKDWYVRIFIETNYLALNNQHRCLSHHECPMTGKRFDEGPMPDHLDAGEHWFPYKCLRKCEPEAEEKTRKNGSDTVNIKIEDHMTRYDDGFIFPEGQGFRDFVLCRDRQDFDEWREKDGKQYSTSMPEPLLKAIFAHSWNVRIADITDGAEENPEYNMDFYRAVVPGMALSSATRLRRWYIRTGRMTQ